MLRFINPKLSRDAVRESLARLTTRQEVSGIEVPVLEGAVILDGFLTPEARQHIEGQIYSSGTDLQQVYRTSRAGFGKNELSITEADQQVPVLCELRAELDDFLRAIFPTELTTHVLQLRELSPQESGHPRHVDYQRGADVVEIDGARSALTSLSLSLPISWNGGRAPAFIMETAAGDVVQTTPGSLAIFGPRVYHSHPPTTDFQEPYLWLVTQAFFSTAAGATSLAALAPLAPDTAGKVSGWAASGSIRSALAAGNADLASADPPPATATIAGWASQLISDRAALGVLRISETRIRNAFGELLSGYEIDPASILNEVERVTDYQGLVTVTGIDFTSLCGHHFLPFYGTIDVTYEPNQVITGLGKIPRLVRAFAGRLQLQEDLVRDVATQIAASLEAKGVLVVAEAVHLCMHSRGPHAPSTRTRCVYGLGSLEQFSRRLAFNRP
jgi:GTP cyclohydrolase IA